MRPDTETDKWLNRLSQNFIQTQSTTTYICWAKKAIFLLNSTFSITPATIQFEHSWLMNKDLPPPPPPPHTKKAASFQFHLPSISVALIWSWSLILVWMCTAQWGIMIQSLKDITKAVFKKNKKNSQHFGWVQKWNSYLSWTPAKVEKHILHMTLSFYLRTLTSLNLAR